MKNKRILFIALVAALFSGMLPFAAQAQDNEGSSGLSISPTRRELVVEPGKADVVDISLKNVSGIDITAQAFINDFEATDTGEPRIIVDPNQQSPASIRNFLIGVEDIPLKKDEKKEFKIPVQVPADAAPGAYYGIIRYAAIPAGRDAPDDGQVALTASVGTLVLIEVPGDITEQIQIRAIRALNNDKFGSFFLTPPNKAAIEIKNNGNSFSKPFGRVGITDITGKEVYSYEMNSTDPRGNILPASTRVFTDDLQNIKTPGRYTITANIAHGDGSEVLTHSATFWYMPLWILAMIAAALLGIVGVAYVIYRRRFRGKSKKRR